MIYLLLLLGSFRGVDHQPIDKIEVNHTPAFTQVILWDWSDDYVRYDVVGWWVVAQDSDRPTQLSDLWRVEYRGKRYSTRVCTQSWTRNDPERDNAKLFPQEWRCYR